MLIRFKFCICPNLLIILVSFSILIGINSCDKTEVPSVRTVAVSELTDISALSGGDILNDGGEIITEKGICWKKGNIPSVEDNLVINSEDSLTFSSPITGLEPGITYCVRAFAKNKVGIGYGDPVYFSTYPTTPFISDVIINSITNSSANITGYFNVGEGLTILAAGICYSTSPQPDLSDMILERQVVAGTINITLSPLKESSLYYARLYIIVRLNSTLKDYLFFGNESSFKTITPPPTVVTEKISSITNCNAKITGVVLHNGSSPILQRGICLGTSPQPTITNTVLLSPGDIGSYQIELNNLNPLTIYYARAFATNIAGTSYGAQIQFETYGTVSDIQGNIYRTIRLGNQIWMHQNLKATVLNDKTEIKRVDDLLKWISLIEPAYCWYNNNDLDTVYGPLYNGFTIKTNKICPSGWHVPSESEWRSLNEYFGGSATKMMNEVTGFAPLYAGQRANNFIGRNDYEIWWSSSLSPADMAFHILQLTKTGYIILRLNDWRGGLSVRCVKDAE